MILMILVILKKDGGPNHQLDKFITRLTENLIK